MSEITQEEIDNANFGSALAGYNRRISDIRYTINSMEYAIDLIQDHKRIQEKELESLQSKKDELLRSRGL